MRRILKTWWPLAASWILMGAEGPALSAVVARLANPEINLAAYGGIVFPLSLIIEAPVMMLLAASTALSKDWASYRKLYRVMMAMGAALTLVHILVAFTPLYYLVARGLIGAPEEIIEPGRIGLMIMTPWTWAIAYRRFQQGVLIRYGHSKAVGVGSAVRLTADVTVLALGYAIGGISGVVVATGAVAAGVLSEAAYAGWRVQPVLRMQLRLMPPQDPPLTLGRFFAFYSPLALTSLLTLLAQPIGSAGLSRMPQPLVSLAVWPVLSGFMFMFRGAGMAYNEVVLALLDEPHSFHNLRRFAVILSAAATASLLLITGTPLAALWFERVSALDPQLAALAHTGLWISLPLPALTVLLSWYQGNILHSGRTRSISESVFIALFVSVLTLAIGVIWGRTIGLYVGVLALVNSTLVQTLWLKYRSRQVLRASQAADIQPTP